ncbi:SipW-dependent-type signal peptide-containing protein [Corynebacterium sp. A21]|uniref:SipW-dependent-type signal peptide-containing protein n=1 Tax=Corynebacterium sp. A21 TaxID=3457318 RepID=UPI003FD4531E
MQATPRASRQARAVIAVAAVLGFGSVATLALWTDSEFAYGFFRTQSFSVESAPTPNESEFDSHDSVEGAVSLDFGLNTGQLTENQPVSDEIWLRMSGEASGRVQLLAPTILAPAANDLSPFIEVQVSLGACGTDEMVLQNGRLSELSGAAPAQAFQLKGGTESSPGSPQSICIDAELVDTVDLPAGEYSTGMVSWEFLITEESR